MERPINIVLIAIVAFFTLAELTLAVSDNMAIERMVKSLNDRCGTVVRMQDKYIESPFFTSLATHPTPTSLLDKEIADIAAKCLPADPPYTSNELFAPPDPGSMDYLQIRLARAYNAYVFETSKSVFMNLQTYIAATNPRNRVLLDALAHLWEKLRTQGKLAQEYQFHAKVPHNVRPLKLPSYVAEPSASDRVENIVRKARRAKDGDIASYFALINDYRFSFETAITAVGKHHLDHVFRRVTGRILATDTQKRFEALVNPRKWTRGWTYRKLNDVPITELRWLPVLIAHERLIIARARHDMERLRYFGDDSPEKHSKVSIRRAEYGTFIDCHVKKMRLYEQASLDGDISGDTTVAVPHTTNYGIAQTHLQDDSPTRQRSINLNVVERQQDHSNPPPLVLISGIDGTSDPMVTDVVYRPILDLLGQDSEDDSDAPPSGMIDFLGQANEQELTLSLGTYNPERYEASTSPLEKSFLSLSSIHNHAAESSTQSHNGRDKGKRPIQGVGPPPGYVAHHAYGNLGDGYPRKKKGQ
ncbi:hypothetical protein SeLEV6574_g04807 [Synchytrium endobioticum]|uniref:Uncharacterized protein n=1 Tax=Synchytrium endobioticum TaxID=286115 RepID=A0A507CXH4_9FUNG|nr:hypothetical protein SeLEV6574_g04807 [Synchytrium endobioticum]